MSVKKWVSSSLITAALCGAVTAQESTPKQGSLPPQTNANQGAEKQDASKHLTQTSVTPQQIATCLAVDNQEEVILCKFAQEKTKNEEVAKFAKMIAEEHQSCLKKLSKLAPDAAREGYLTGSRADQPISNPSKDQKPNQINASSKTSVDMVQLQREM